LIRIILELTCSSFTIAALTFAEECRDVDDCTHVECPEDDYELECVRESCTCTHGKFIFMYSDRYIIDDERVKSSAL